MTIGFLPEVFGERLFENVRRTGLIHCGMMLETVVANMVHQSLQCGSRYLSLSNRSAVKRSVIRTLIKAPRSAACELRFAWRHEVAGIGWHPMLLLIRPFDVAPDGIG